jgi:hypothetical protein
MILNNSDLPPGNDNLVRQLSKEGSAKKKKNTTSSFVAASKYGETRQESDEEDDGRLAGLTPNTKRRIVHEIEVEGTGKLGAFATAFTLFKGFVATGILYMPKNFVNGGWLFSPFILFVCMLLTLYCIKLLLDVRAKLGGSFSEIGFKSYGRCGKMMVDITLFGSQTGFTCAYVYFIAN